MAGDINNPVPGLYMHKRKATLSELENDATFLDGQLGFVFPDALYGKLSGTLFKINSNVADVVFKDGTGAPFTGNIGIVNNEPDFVDDTNPLVDSMQMGAYSFLLGTTESLLTYNAYVDGTGYVKVDNGQGSGMVNVRDGAVEILTCPSSEDDLDNDFRSMIRAFTTRISLINSSASWTTSSVVPTDELFRNSLNQGRLEVSKQNNTSSLLGNYNCDITTLGAVAGGSASSNRIALQNAVDRVGSKQFEYVYIPPGVFDIDTYITIDNDVKIVGAPGATLRASTSQNVMLTNETGGSGGYAGNKNITIQGIKFDGGRSVSSAEITCIGFAHCENIKIIDCDFTSWADWHAIEYNACKDSSVINCKFYDAKKIDKSEEAIQWDLANSSTAFPWPAGAPFDGTPCDGIVVENCTFENIATGMGCHNSVQNVPQKNIRVSNCTFRNLTERCIRVYSCSDMIIENCNAEDVDMFFHFFATNMTGLNLKNIIVTNNTVNDARYGMYMTTDGGVTTPIVRNIIFSDNTLTNITKVVGSARALWLEGTSSAPITKAMVSGNTVDTTSQYGLTCDFGDDISMIGNYVTNCEQNGMVFYAVSDGVISGNNVQYNYKNASYYDIRVYNDPRNILLSGNLAGKMQVDTSSPPSRENSCKITGNSLEISLGTTGADALSNGNYIAHVWTP